MFQNIHYAAHKTMPTQAPTDEVVQLTLRAFRKPPWRKKYTADYVLERLQAPWSAPAAHIVFARQEEGTLAGYALSSAETCDTHGPFVMLSSLCVDPAYHGQGIGRKLAEMVVEEAKAREVGFVLLSTLRKSPAAELYKKMGFVRRADVNPRARTWVMRLDLHRG